MGSAASFCFSNVAVVVAAVVAVVVAVVVVVVFFCRHRCCYCCWCIVFLAFSNASALVANREALLEAFEVHATCDLPVDSVNVM